MAGCVDCEQYWKQIHCGVVIRTLLDIINVTSREPYGHGPRYMREFSKLPVCKDVLSNYAEVDGLQVVMQDMIHPQSMINILASRDTHLDKENADNAFVRARWQHLKVLHDAIDALYSKQKQ